MSVKQCPVCGRSVRALYLDSSGGVVYECSDLKCEWAGVLMEDDILLEFMDKILGIIVNTL